MAKEKVTAPQGMRDFGPAEMVRRNYIFSTIRKVYEKYGYVQIETPAMEKLSTLTGKYGDEGDKLIFKVLNSGNFFGDFTEEDVSKVMDVIKLKLAKKLPYDQAIKMEEKDVDRTINKIVTSVLRKMSEKALKYDLTVPFARYVVQNSNNLKFPFRRYQIQPVWRADRPQKARYREFYQCDADIVGSTSLISEIEFVQIYNEVFNKLNLKDYLIKLNNRKILSGILEIIGGSDKFREFTVVLDKLDKLDKERVLIELSNQGFTVQQMDQLSRIIDLRADNDLLLTYLGEFLASSEIGMKGLEEVREVLEISYQLGLQNGKLQLDVTLARGLDYYTGCIFEVVIENSGMGSVSGGGRYDDLTGIFGMTGLSGVGISFGADRIYDLLLSRNLFPEFHENKIQIMFLNFGKKESLVSLKLAQNLRDKNIKTIVYPDAIPIKKQMNYANELGVFIVCSIGSMEIENGTIEVKDMQTGLQTTHKIADFNLKFGHEQYKY